MASNTLSVTETKVFPRRSSVVVIPPMQVCPGDLLVYSKALTHRGNYNGKQSYYTMDWENLELVMQLYGCRVLIDLIGLLQCFLKHYMLAPSITGLKMMNWSVPIPYMLLV